MNKLSFSKIVEKYNELLQSIKAFDCLVRDSDLQKEKIFELQKLLVEMKFYKLQAQQISDEVSANRFFHFQCVLNSQIASLKMWISLKGTNYEDAWNHLIDAQEYLEYSLKTPEQGTGLVEYKNRLESIEKNIFPGFPLYNSIGLIVKGGICSICGEPIECCDHLEDEIYWGRVCKRVAIESFEVTHTALVEKPKDRRCTIKSIEAENGLMRDYMTWKLLDERIETSPESFTLKATLFSLKILDIF
ncbi:hypothetical protein [Leptospira noguchii]|uniref:hypothetical protein n=1 Tax=Leptospira noguchii TaxID=28182 RepID=UPI0002C03C2D|nr:hypothetical protein [Leptospira noguchii]EMI72611.1 hypothetical protein LEP1GSC072_2808 [Leptospira noguchii str. Bonito]